VTVLDRNPRTLGKRVRRVDFNPSLFRGNPLLDGFAFLGYSEAGHRIFNGICGTCSKPFHTREPVQLMCKRCRLSGVDTFSSSEEGWVQCSRIHEVNRDGVIRRIDSWKIIKPWSHKSGHLYVRLQDGGSSRQVHHIVMEHFGTQRPKNTECRHLDGNPKNNQIDNLAWGTRADNIRDFQNDIKTPLQ
jgi:hypothetical protein